MELRLTAKHLNEIGTAMYGEDWKSALSRDINVNRKTVQRWAEGKFYVPAWAVNEILRLAKYYGGLLEGRQNKILKIVERIEDVG